MCAVSVNANKFPYKIKHTLKKYTIYIIWNIILHMYLFMHVLTVFHFLYLV